MVKFKNALHSGYSGLNKLEEKFAKALDKLRQPWCRNPSQSGFGIPLLDRGKTNTFHPDFLVWKPKSIIAIDTKGDHLLVEESRRKIFHIEKMEKGPDLLVRFIAEGQWVISSDGSLNPNRNKPGFTLLAVKQGRLSASHFPTIDAVAVGSVK